MFLANASTQRPIAMSCLLIALIALGLNSYRKLSIENMPAVDIPYIAVVTQWVGASPEDVEKDVSKHVEDAVSGIDGLKHVESSSLENVSQIVLEFNLGTEDFVLLLARMEDIEDGKLDTAKVKAFRAPAGTLVEVYATTLHYAPCHVRPPEEVEQIRERRCLK